MWIGLNFTAQPIEFSAQPVLLGEFPALPSPQPLHTSTGDGPSTDRVVWYVTWGWMHTVSQNQQASWWLIISLAYVDWFSNFFNQLNCKQFSMYTPQRFPPHLQHVAILRCKIWKSKNVELARWKHLSVATPLVMTVFLSLCCKAGALRNGDFLVFCLSICLPVTNTYLSVNSAGSWVAGALLGQTGRCPTC